jgi:4-hydroxy-3-polyprenylbenzoate decarboxylase
MRHIASLREFVAELEAIGEIQPIGQEVDWNLEMGAIIRRSYDLRAPAPLFNAITGIEPGFRVLGAPGGLSGQAALRYARVALALGLSADAGGLEIIEALAAARARPGIPPRLVAEGACQENVLIGDDVDLMRFPTPWIHGGDGGRYINTYGINIVRTPDGRWTNWSINRMMLADAKRLACLIPPNQHLGMIDAEWKQRGERTPIAVALGAEPGLAYVAGMPLPAEISESDYMGAYFGEPIDVVACQTIDLQVPASAEIVIEGYISHDETAMEGPMGEYAGYVAPPPGTLKPVLEVTAVTYRNQPILPVVAAGKPVEEDHTVWGLPHAAEMLHELRSADLPVAGCWMVLESANSWLVVAVRGDWHERLGIGSRDLAQRVGDIVFPSKAGFGIPKILLMEDNVDITDVNDVVWAFGSRAHPGHGEIYFAEEATTNLPIFLDDAEKHVFRGTKVVHNCLLNDHYPPGTRPGVVSFRDGWPREIQQRVLEHWHAYGYR